MHPGDTFTVSERNERPRSLTVATDAAAGFDRAAAARAPAPAFTSRRAETERSGAVSICLNAVSDDENRLLNDSIK